MSHTTKRYSVEQIEDLRRRLAELGPDVYAKKGLAYQHFEVDGQVLIEGEHRDRCVERSGWIRELDLADKSVLDLGCNLGLFAMEAKGCGAQRALGIDIQKSTIDAAAMIRDFLGLDHCDFQVVDLTRPEGRNTVDSVDVLLAFAVYDHFTDRHKQVPPWERENAYLQITEWFAHLTRELMIAEFHNHQQKWSKFFEEILEEHGFELAEKRITHIERPVYFCRRTDQGADELRVGSQSYSKVKSWAKRRRMIYLLEQEGKRYLCKRYSYVDLQEGRSPEQEARILQAFADCPEVLQPVAHDQRRIVLPYFDGRPLEVNDEQPLDAVQLTDAMRMRVVAAVANLLSCYLERRDALYQQFQDVIPEIYREEVRSGARLLIDVSPSNILVADSGEVAFVDFEPTKPARTQKVVAHLASLAGGIVPGGTNGFLSRWFGS